MHAPNRRMFVCGRPEWSDRRLVSATEPAASSWGARAPHTFFLNRSLEACEEMSMSTAGEFALERMVGALAELIEEYLQWSGRPPTELEARDVFNAAMSAFGELVEVNT